MFLALFLFLLYVLAIGKAAKLKGIMDMKKIGLGIAILLFGILLEISVQGSLSYISWGIGIIGLLFAIVGCVSNKKEE